MLMTFPDWVTNEKFLTLATWGLVMVTFLLVLATLLLYLDGRSKGKEQRRRWDKEDADHERERNELHSRWAREDAVRDKQQALDYRFDVKPSDTDVIVWVANLGTTSFLATRIWLDIANPFNPGQRLPKKKGLEWNAVLAAGETKEFTLPEGYLLGSPVGSDGDVKGYHQCEISLEVDHLGKLVRSPITTFKASVDKEGRLEMFVKDE